MVRDRVSLSNLNILRMSELWLLQRFAVERNRNTMSTLALAEKIFSEEKHASTVGVAQ